MDQSLPIEHYQLRAGEAFQQGFNRVAAAELDLAIDLVATRGGTPEAVHEARKSLKRLRSLLRLARPLLSGAQFRCENARLRQAADGLSAARDAEVMLLTFDALADKTRKGRRIAADGRTFRELLQARRRHEAGQLSVARLGATLELLQEARDSLARLPFATPRSDGLATGLATMMRQARKAYTKAYRRHDPEAFHDLRKSVQHYYRQMQLLSPAWPELLNVHIDEAKALADLLGDEHDLSVLREQVLQHRQLFAGDKPLRRLYRRIDKRQQRMRRKAKRGCRRLFMSEKPRCFARRLLGLHAHIA